MKKYTLLCVVLLSGCASVASTLSGSSSGVLPHKDNSFMISTGNAVPSSAQKQAYEEAMEFCKEKKAEFNVLGSLGERTERFTLYFYCK